MERGSYLCDFTCLWPLRLSCKHENHSDAAQENEAFKTFGEGMKLFKMNPRGTLKVSGLDLAPGGDSVLLHRRQNMELRVRGDGKHDCRESHRNREPYSCRNLSAKPEHRRCEAEDSSSDQADPVKDPKRTPDDQPSLVRAFQSLKGDRCDNECKEDEAAYPGDHGQ